MWTKFMRTNFGLPFWLCVDLWQFRPFALILYTMRMMWHQYSESISTDSKLQFHERFHFHLHITCAPVYLLLPNSFGVFSVSFYSSILLCSQIASSHFLSLFPAPLFLLSLSLYNHHINHETMFVEPYMLAMMVGQWSHSSRMWKGGWVKYVVNGIILEINLINWWTSNIYRTNYAFVQWETIGTSVQCEVSEQE